MDNSNNNNLFPTILSVEIIIVEKVDGALFQIEIKRKNKVIKPRII